jgi:hypothetical protein
MTSTAPHNDHRIDPTTPEDLEVNRMLAALTNSQQPVKVLHIEMSKVSDENDDDRTPDVVHLRDYSENKGWASLPGPQYGYHIYYSKGSVKELCGNLSPQPELIQNLFGFVGNGGPHLEEVTAEDIHRHVLLTATGRKVADMVVSESPIVRRKDIAAN